MKQETELNAQDVADILHVSKSTVYDLIHKDEIRSYKVGRKVRFSHSDVMDYIEKSKRRQHRNTADDLSGNDDVFETFHGLTVHGQDMILDVLANYLNHFAIPAKRAFVDSYEALVNLYKLRANVAAAHLWDSKGNDYNISFTKRLVPGIPTVIVNLVQRTQGFYVNKKNPKNIVDWGDFARDDVIMVNRERGSGSRILLDEKFRAVGVDPTKVTGYKNEATSISVLAKQIVDGRADVGVGVEGMSHRFEEIEFIPIQKERYDIIYRKEDENNEDLKALLKIINSIAFRQEFSTIGGYDTSLTGEVIAEL